MASITRFYALVLSTVLLISGVPGFFPNIDAFQALVTFFALTLVHAVLHTAVGLLGLLITALASDESVRVYTFGIAVLYGALAVVGIVGVNFAPILYFNSADNWMHGSIFALSLGIALAGVAEERMRHRTANLIEAMPEGHWALPSSPMRLTGDPMGRALAQGTAANTMAGGIYESSEIPWSNQPRRDERSQNQSQNQWAQNPWPLYQPSTSQPLPQPASQPLPQPRDPWTREQRPLPGQPRVHRASAPSGEQRQEDPTGPHPPRQNPWSLTPPPMSQPSQGPSSQSRWQPESRPGDARRASEPQEQWPLDEWPSLHDTQPTP